MEKLLEDEEEDAGSAGASPGRSGDSAAAAIEPRPGGGFAWENGLRCLFLSVIIVLTGVIIWQPGFLRLSALVTFGNPSHGESLSWTPDPDLPPDIPEPKRIRPPAEWRPSSALAAGRDIERLDVPPDGLSGGSLSKPSWRRYSSNPWNWSDDGDGGRGRGTEETAAQPSQKSASEFRAGDAVSWSPTPAASPGASGQGVPETFPTLPPPLPGTGAGGLPSPLPALGDGPLPLPDPLAAGRTALPNLPPLPGSSAPAPETPAARSADGGPALPAPAGGASLRPPEPEEEIDWKNREITGAIPDAFLTIYPKLKFIGLCVPGQGYIRKYNQVGVPADLDNPKMGARDGRTPYGRYYIADRHRDADGPRLFISWPSPDDARRIGLEPGRQAQVDGAWRTLDLPPQDTAAGGGVGLTGLRHWVDVTEGGFALEAPHMEEIFTALPDKAWVFIQP